MNTIYILILIFGSNFNGKAIHSIEFTSKTACVAALDTIESKDKNVSLYCVKK